MATGNKKKSSGKKTVNFATNNTTSRVTRSMSGAPEPTGVFGAKAALARAAPGDPSSEEEEEQQQQRPQQRRKAAAAPASDQDLEGMLKDIVARAVGSALEDRADAVEEQLQELRATVASLRSSGGAAPAKSSDKEALIAAQASKSYTTAAAGHITIYNFLSLCAKEGQAAQQAGEHARAEKYLSILAAATSLSNQAAEHLARQPGYGLNAMVAYIQQSLSACLEDPATATFNKSVAETVVASVRTDSGRSSGQGGARRGAGSGMRDRRAGDKREREERNEDKGYRDSKSYGGERRGTR